MISKYVILMREVSYDECPDSDYIFHKRPRDDLKKKGPKPYMGVQYGHLLDNGWDLQ